MDFLHNATKLNPAQRRAIAVLTAILLLTSTRVQAAGASAVLPDAPQWEAGQTLQADAPDRGLVVPTELTGELTVRPERIMKVTITSYNSVPGQTDDSPFITADGSHVRDGIIAANFLKFGTKVRIPELFGDKVFEVHDRMNKRFSDRVDIWMADVPASKQFGIRHNVTIEVL